MQHKECYGTQKDLDRLFWLKTFSHLHSSSLYNSQMIGQGPLAGQSNFFGRNYLPFNNKGKTLNINNYEKLNRSLPKYMTVCIESCGTGDKSFSIGGPFLLWSIHTDELITTKTVGESFFLVDMVCQIDLALIQNTARTLSKIIMTTVQNAKLKSQYHMLRIDEGIWEPINLASSAVVFQKFTVVSCNFVFADIRIIGDYTSQLE